MAKCFIPHGYVVQSGYIGFLKDGTKMLFETEDAYKDYINEEA